MMPAQTQLPVGHSNRSDETAIPLPTLLASRFDRDTVEATVPLADRTIFVAPNGRRFLFESIPDRAESTGGITGFDYAAPPSPDSPLLPAAGAAPGPGVAYANVSTKELQVMSAAPIRRRPVSGVAPHATEPSPWESTKQIVDMSGLETKSPTQAVEHMMNRLSINRFSATPFYTHSDGGVQAAETLTDPHPVPGLPIPESPVPRHVTSATGVLVGTSSCSQPSVSYSPHAYAASSSYTAPNLLWSSHATDYEVEGAPVAEAAQHDTHRARYQSVASEASAHPSLLEMSMPIPSTSPASQIALRSASQDIELDYHQTLQVHTDVPYAPDSYSISPFTQTSYINQDDGMQGNTIVTYNTSNYDPGWNATSSPFDTLTPVIVVEPESQLYPASSRSDGASVGRENVLPGEEVLYDGWVKLAQNLSAPFVEAALKVFRNTLSNDLRFHCKIGHESETYWVKGVNGQIVPVYAYDQRFVNILYIRDKNSEKPGFYSTPVHGNSSHPSAVYQFPRFQELCEFQAKLTGEKVVLDISSAKLLKLRKAHSRSSETFSSIRLQIWHEEDSRRPSQSDVSSFVTAGTTLSGPHRDRLVPRSSRLMVFLGRLDEYVTVFVTDDIEIVPQGQTTVKLKPRKGGSVFKRGSRWPGVKGNSYSPRILCF
ncbi:hypothetical protein VTK73DRAFT_9762 [Phialemonium thermophilum]|uniref:Uncharacterized protein n=1 Tax=Phialemonium thermophilum TaxID=223376 RepID=A0ABR3XJK8_9PEZI